MEDVLIKILQGVLVTLILSTLGYIANKVSTLFTKVEENAASNKRIEATLNGALKAYDERLELLEKEVRIIKEILVSHSETIDSLK